MCVLLMCVNNINIIIINVYVCVLMWNNDING